MRPFSLHLHSPLDRQASIVKRSTAAAVSQSRIALTACLPLHLLLFAITLIHTIAIAFEMIPLVYMCDDESIASNCSLHARCDECKCVDRMVARRSLVTVNTREGWVQVKEEDCKEEDLAEE